MRVGPIEWMYGLTLLGFLAFRFARLRGSRGFAGKPGRVRQARSAKGEIGEEEYGQAKALLEKEPKPAAEPVPRERNA